uniref:NADH-ubiquinone oxidoreductase chain 6 n=1 Tax=Coleoptera sp. ACP-2013 TaxID=2485033 RepID=A0A3G3MEN9_9COLE|nr:NADH dehydrogenase subunit 6 [Coleoptera sp. ACP-2013]
MIMMMMSSIMFLFMNHPLSLGLILLIQTTLTAMLTGYLNYSYWFSYILFLIMIGGMLVLFMYMTSIASNEKFKFSFKLFIMLMTMIALCFPMMMMFMDKMLISIKFINLNMNKQSVLINELMSMNKYMNLPNNISLMIIIFYLLITLIAIVKITSIKYGPLRQKF